MNDVVKLTVPAQRAYVLVIRTALGGVALVNDLTIDTLEDLRQAADEACDCLMHQGAAPTLLHLEAHVEADRLCVSLMADFEKAAVSDDADSLEISRAVLETLIPEVTLHARDNGLVERIDLTVPRAHR